MGSPVRPRSPESEERGGGGSTVTPRPPLSDRAVGEKRPVPCEEMRKKPAIVIVNDKIQSGYTYRFDRAYGTQLRSGISAGAHAKRDAALGHLLRQVHDRLPRRISTKLVRASQAVAGGDATAGSISLALTRSQPLSLWRAKGWIHSDDPRGWFQWYCRYYMGRRMPDEDRRQIARWKAMRRHIRQVQRNCHPGDLACRPRQRQALLHWAYDSRRT